MKKEKSSTDSPVGDVISYSVTVAAGLLTMWASIRKTFYDNILKSGIFDGIRADRNRQFDGIKHLTGTEFISSHCRIANDYASKVNEIIAAKGIRNSWDKFQFLGTSEKATILGTAMAVTGVAIGAIYSVRHKWHIAQKLEELNQKKEAGAPTLS